MTTKKPAAESRPQEIPVMSVARTDNGIELPVLDITHPLFTEDLDENTFLETCRRARGYAPILANMPGFMKAYIRRVSGLDGGYLSGLRTLAVKLGPKLAGKGKVPFWDRYMARQFGAVAIRFRLLAVCAFQSEALVPELRAHPGRDLLFVNIAGGPASDTFNTLFLIRDRDPSLLEGRRIEILNLDVDTFGPNFAARSLEALLAPGARLHGLDVTYRHIPYSWENAGELGSILPGTGERIIACASEGGLFEYASDLNITENLKMLAAVISPEAALVGSVLMEPSALHPAYREMGKISRISNRYLGMNGLSRLAEGTGWRIETTKDIDTIFTVFRLRRTV